MYSKNKNVLLSEDSNLNPLNPARIVFLFFFLGGGSSHQKSFTPIIWEIFLFVRTMPRSMLHGKRKRLPWEKSAIGIIRILDSIIYIGNLYWKLEIGNKGYFIFPLTFWTFWVGWLERKQFLSGLFCWCFFSLNLDFLLVLFCWWVNDLILPFFFPHDWTCCQWVFARRFFLNCICLFFFPGWSPPVNPVDWFFDSIRFGVLENSVGFHGMLSVWMKGFGLGTCVHCEWL